MIIEASFVVDTIVQLVSSRQFEPGIVVMYKCTQPGLIEEAFSRHGCLIVWSARSGFMDGARSRM
jgi:hypothetical protein